MKIIKALFPWTGSENRVNFPRENSWCLLRAFVACFLFSGWILWTGTFWETNDDPSIAYLFSLEGNDYSPFQWRLLSVIMHILFAKLPVINWWAVNCVLAVSICALSITYVIYRRYVAPYSDIFAVVVLGMLWATAGYAVNFTRSAAVLAMGGCILVADGVLNHQKMRWGEYLIGIFLLLYGGSIRSNSALMALGFLAVLGGVWLLTDGFEFSLVWFTKHRRQIGGLLGAALLFLGVSRLDIVLLTAEQKEYLDYNSLRSEIQDYPRLFPAYEIASDTYRNIGVNEITRDVLLSWFSEDTEIMTMDVMTKMAEVKNNQASLYLLNDRRIGSSNLILAAGLVCLLLSIHKKRNFILLLLPGFFAILFSMYLSLTGRLPARVFEPVITLMLLAMIFLCGDHDGVAVSPKSEKENAIIKKPRLTWGKKFICLFLVFCSTLLTYKHTDTLQGSLEHIWDSRKTMQEYRNKTFGYIENSEEYIYVYDLYENPHSISYAFTMWEPRDIGYCDNFYLLGGWDARHPHAIKRLSDFGVQNPVRALSEHPRVRSVYSDRLQEYLHTNYDPRITISGMFEAGNTQIVQYCAPIDDALIGEMQAEKVHVEKVQHSNVTIRDRTLSSLCFEAQIQPNDEKYRDFYCNMSIDQVRYTYRLHYDDGRLYSEFYNIDSQFDWRDADLRVFELTDEGRYILYEIA